MLGKDKHNNERIIARIERGVLVQMCVTLLHEMHFS